MEKIKSIELVKNERIRQITEEGYSLEYDDQKDMHQLSNAAIVYATHLTDTGVRWTIMDILKRK